MPLPPEPGTGDYCFKWGDEYWGKDYPGWTDFRKWLVDHGADPNTWIDAHPSAASCIGAVKTAAPGAPPPPPPPPPAAKAKCFDWGGESWGKDYPGWTAFEKWLREHGVDPDTWISAHPSAAQCIGAPAPVAPPGPQGPPTPPTPKPPPKPPPTPSGSAWPSPPWRGKGFLIVGVAFGRPIDAGKVVADMQAAGARWVAVETYPDDNSAAFPALLAAVHGIGGNAGIWERTDQVDFAHVQGKIDALKPDFYLADLETNWSRPENATLPADFAAAYPTLPRAALMAGMPDAVYCKPWIDASFDCMTQAYVGQSGIAPSVGIAGSLDNDAYFRGWPRNAVPAPAGWGGHDDGPHTWPVIEIHAENNPGVREQLGAVAPWGDNFAVYPYENVTADDLAAMSGAGPAPGAPGAPAPATKQDPSGKRYCFEWGGEKWGGDFPGWDAFKKWLGDHGANPTTWINTHLDAAVCIGAPGAAETQAGQSDPGSAQGTVDTRYQYFYTHLADRGLPSEGDAVDKGQRIGYVMKAPDTANHTHLGVHRPSGPNNVGVRFPKEAGPVHPGEKPAADFTTDHPTGGLDGYPAHDFLAAAGTEVLAVESGFITKLSGHPESAGDVDPAQHVYGHNVYLTAYGSVYQPPTGAPPGTPPPVEAPPPPAPTGKKEPPATKSAWQAFKAVFAKHVPAKRDATKAVLAHPKEFL